MALETADLRRLLEDAYDDSVAASANLRDTLRSKERAAGATVAGGSLASISRNGASHSYAFGKGTVSTSDMARGYRTLIDLYDVILDGEVYTTDPDIKAEMMRRLVPCNEFTKDFTCLNYR